MEFFRNLLSSLIILAAIPLLFMTTLSVVLSRTVFSEDYVRREVAASNLYAGIADLAAFASREEGSDTIESKVVESLTPDKAQHIFEPAIGQLFAWLRGERELAITLDLRGIKADLAPSLTAAERQALDEAYPDELALAGGVEADRELSGMVRLKEYYRLATRYRSLLPVVTLGLIALLVIVNTGRSRLRRPAYVFLIVGILSAMVGGAGEAVKRLAMGRLSEGSGLSEVLQTSLQQFAERVSNDVTQTILIIGLAYIVLAVILFAVSFVLPPSAVAKPVETPHSHVDEIKRRLRAP